MHMIRILAAMLSLVPAVAFVACEEGKTKPDAGKKTQGADAKERPVRADSPLLKVTPDFTGFDWKAQRRIENTDFTKERVYFFMVDRYADGDADNNMDVIKGDYKAYNGGDLKGATARLSHIKDMGFSAIWISPIVDNDETPAGGAWWFYHGYHFKDPYTVDEHFGKNQDFVDFVAEAHKLGLKVLLDVVVNHSGHTFPLRPERNAAFKKWFHFPFKDISNYFDDKESVENALMGAPDFDQRNPNAAAFLMDYIKFWISTANIDGLRIDTVKHVHMEFWPKFVKAIKEYAGPGFFLMGEVWESQLPLCKKYMNQGKLDSLVDFPLYYKFEQVFTKDGNMNELSNNLQEDKQWADAENLGVFVDNHDVVRFTMQAGEHARDLLKAGLAFVYTIRGFPVVYYGTETMMKGKYKTDWGGRDMMPWADIDAGKHADMIGYIRKLNDLKATAPALHRGAKHTEIYKDYSVYAYVRSVAGDAVFAVINKQPGDTVYTFDLPAQAGFKGQLTDVLSGQKFAMAGNKLTLRMKARQSYVFHVTGGAAVGPRVVAFDQRLPAGITKVTFKLKAPTAKVVMLAGAFNGWDQKSTKLTKGADGTWSLTIPLKAGKYEYKFIVDGNWTADPDAKENSGPPYGNSLITVQ